MSKPILNLDELEFFDFGNGDGFACRMGMISRRIGGEQLGYNLTVVPPGKKAFPFHSHRHNEEMFFILEGSGEARVGEKRYPLRPGDVVACPAGGPESAHQFINTGETDLKYLSVSTSKSPEVAQYPDSDKVGVIAEMPGENEQGIPNLWRLMVRMEHTGVDYWDGED